MTMAEWNPEWLGEALWDYFKNDLTYEGYSRGITALRKRDPARAKEIERYLRPQYFRRKEKLDLPAMSEGTRLRVCLLPHNPHLTRDVAAARDCLGLPQDQIKPTPDEPLWQELAPMAKSPEAARKLIEGIYCSEWTLLHRQAPPPAPGGRSKGSVLSAPLKQSAKTSAQVKFNSNLVPLWLITPPSGPPPYDSEAIPLDRVTGRLIELYRLPWHVVGGLSYYVLTENPAWVTDLEPLTVEIVYAVKPAVPGTFTISVSGIDEYIRKGDWDRIWQRHIVPRQDRLWQEQGQKPQGRRGIDLAALQQYLPLYSALVKRGDPVGQVIESGDWADTPFSDLLNEKDEKDIRAAFIQLRQLLEPIG